MIIRVIVITFQSTSSTSPPKCSIKAISMLGVFLQRYSFLEKGQWEGQWCLKELWNHLPRVQLSVPLMGLFPYAWGVKPVWVVSTKRIWNSDCILQNQCLSHWHININDQMNYQLLRDTCTIWERNYTSITKNCLVYSALYCDSNDLYKILLPTSMYHLGNCNSTMHIIWCTNSYSNREKKLIFHGVGFQFRYLWAPSWQSGLLHQCEAIVTLWWQ